MTPSNESNDRNQSNAGGKSMQASGRQGKSPGSHTPRGAAVDKSAQRLGGKHSHSGR